jgi:hypothetical protein
MIYTEEHWNTLKRSKRFDLLFELAMLISNAQSIGKVNRGESTWDKVEQNFQSVYGRAKYLYCDTRAIRDPEFVDFLDSYKVNFYEVHQDFDQYDELVATAADWVKDHLILSTDMQLLPMPSTRDALIEFLQKNNHRKVRIHQQEYWNKTQLAHYNTDSEYFHDPDDISVGDCVVITLPLHGNYTLPGWVSSLFETCSKKDVPVFIDTCWAWLQHSFQLNLEYPCIHTVTCTLGKMFPIESFRNGFKYVRKENIKKYDIQYSTNRMGNRILIDLMKEFPADYLVKKYTDKQKYWAEKLQMIPTPSVHNCYCDDDLFWYSEHRMLVHDGVTQNVFSIIPLLENHQILVDYIESKN